LQLALIVAGVKPGDEVICPSFSFIATANAILYVGATPVFVDIDPRTFNINPELIEAAITPRTTAIMPVSQIGLAADLIAVNDIAARHGLRVVEDAAPSLGAMLNGRRIGAISEFTCFSFDARKILTMGEGGVITTNNDEAATQLRQLRAHSASVSLEARHNASTVIIEQYPELGYNYKLTDIQAAIGLVQMKKVDTIIAERRRLAARYAELLSDEEQVELPYEPPGYTHIYQCYCVRLRDGAEQLPVMRHMATNGVSTRRIMSIHEEPFYRRIMPGVQLPETERAARETILLPIFVGLSSDEQDQVASALGAAVKAENEQPVV
jgi:dTDP-4-amino-4,6-dideoxygalactose transaminase